MSDLSLLNEITQSYTNPITEETSFTYTQTVYIMGPICEEWVTGSSPMGMPIMSCSLYSTSSAVDILWDQEPLPNFSSSEVWPFPGTELTTFGNGECDGIIISLNSIITYRPYTIKKILNEIGFDL